MMKPAFVVTPEGVAMIAANITGLAFGILAQELYGLLPLCLTLFLSGYYRVSRARTLVPAVAATCLLAVGLGTMHAWSPLEPLAVADWVTSAVILPLLCAVAVMHPAVRRRLRDGDSALRIIDTMPSHAWSANAQGKYTYVSPATLAYLGVTVPELDPAVHGAEFGWREVVHPEDYALVAQRWRHCLNSGDQYDTEHRIRRHDGSYRWFRNTGLPQRDQYGSIIAWHGTTIDIDEQKRAEFALKEKEEALRHLIDAVPVGIWSLTPGGTPSYMNAKLAELTGVAFEDLIAEDGSPSLTTVHPDDKHLVRNALANGIQSGASFAMTYRQIRRDGCYRWIEARIEPQRNGEGEILQWYSVAIDIHNLMTTQAELRDREQQLAHLIDMVPSHIWRLTPQGEPVFFNQRMSDYLGIGVVQLRGRGAERLSSLVQFAVHPDDRDAFHARFHDALQSGDSLSMTYRLRRADGTYRWMSSRAEPFLDCSGSVMQWYGLCHDIDDQMQVEAALKQSEQQLRQLIDAVPALIWSVERNGLASYVNKRYRDYAGLVSNSEDALAQIKRLDPVSELAHPDEAQGVQATLSACLESGEPFLARFRQRRGDGQYRWTESRAEPLYDECGEILSWYGVTLDIDDEVRTQEALRQANDKLTSATQAASLAELSASIAHEVNQPLAAVVTNSHACQRWLNAQPPNIERAQITVNRILRDANAAADVVSRIRALFKQSMNARSTARISDIVRDVHGYIRNELLKYGITFKVDLDSNLPCVIVDRVQIQQLLINLIRNAIDAMRSSDGEKVLLVRAGRKEQNVRVDIIDNGEGLKQPDRIFDPFFSTKSDGMGMGLAISRSIAESHGGNLWAENNTSGGATFTLKLPVEAGVS